MRKIAKRRNITISIFKANDCSIVISFPTNPIMKVAIAHKTESIAKVASIITMIIFSHSLFSFLLPVEQIRFSS